VPVTFLWFWVTFLGFEVPILSSEMPVTFRRFWGHFSENAALFPPGKKTPHILNPESKFLSTTTHFLMPMLSLPSACPSLDLFRGAAYNAGLSPCSHTTTTTEYVWYSPPGEY